MTVTVTVLGSCGGFPEPNRACAGFLVSLDGFHLLLDLGYGALRELLRALPDGRVDAIIITHVHPDHCADLHPLFRLHHYGTSVERIPVYSPGGILSALGGVEPDVGLGEVFDERPLLGVEQIGPWKVCAASLPHWVHNLGVRLDGGVVVAYTGDCGLHPRLTELGCNADLLIVDATDRPGETEAATRNLMTPREAGMAGAEAGARRVMLTHFWPGNDRAKAVQEAKGVFGGKVLAAEEGMRVVL